MEMAIAKLINAIVRSRNSQMLTALITAPDGIKNIMTSRPTAIKKQKMLIVI